MGKLSLIAQASLLDDLSQALLLGTKVMEMTISESNSRLASSIDRVGVYRFEENFALRIWTLIKNMFLLDCNKDWNNFELQF